MNDLGGTSTNGLLMGGISKDRIWGKRASRGSPERKPRYGYRPPSRFQCPPPPLITGCQLLPAREAGNEPRTRIQLPALALAGALALSGCGGGGGGVPPGADSSSQIDTPSTPTQPGGDGGGGGNTPTNPPTNVGGGDGGGGNTPTDPPANVGGGGGGGNTPTNPPTNVGGGGGDSTFTDPPQRAAVHSRLQNWDDQDTAWKTANSWEGGKNPFQDQVIEVLGTSSKRFGFAADGTFSGSDHTAQTAQTVRDNYGAYRFAGETENAGAIEGIPVAYKYEWDDSANTAESHFGGWMDEMFFIVHLEGAGVTSSGRAPTSLSNNIFVFGNPSSDAPTTTGRITWTGAMAGVDLDTGDRNYGRPLFGRAVLRLTETGLIVNMQALTYNNGDTHNSLSWGTADITITADGGFYATGLDGNFFGTNHEEAGGVFEQDEIRGAFGARKD